MHKQPRCKRRKRISAKKLLRVNNLVLKAIKDLCMFAPFSLLCRIGMTKAQV